MVKILKYFYSYVTPEPWPENPEQEATDPNLDLSLPESVRISRRNLVAISGIAIAWATAQFNPASSKIEIAGFSVDFNIDYIPIFLAVAILYLTFRWGMEFAMMPRTLRRWSLAQLDFRIVSLISRFSLVALAAGAVDRSIWTIMKIVGALGVISLASLFLTIIFMFVTMPIRLWARQRAKAQSVAKAAYEAIVWAILFAVLVAIVSFIIFGIASYTHIPLRDLIWKSPPNPVALSLFVLTLTCVFLSRWFLRPVFYIIFAERPPYTTTRQPDGKLVYQFNAKEKKPLF
jgi:hypothetical protein